ncbi:MAG: SRPBCC family protein [Gordonia sp.]|nr:SRPBCC family protein [Gordonia sp. (in: high G+C Gram-positive bacteria)]OZG27177.1 polyketide cyclase [Williamsia sp. 1138]
MRLRLRHRMPSVELAIAAPAAAVWEVLVDLKVWPEWGPTVSGAELDGPGPLTFGSRGKVWTPVGVPLPFEIDEFVDGRAWGWRVAGVPATRHEVIPTRDGCVLSFGVPVWAPAYLPVMAVALPRIARLATARRSA